MSNPQSKGEIKRTREKKTEDEQVLFAKICGILAEAEDEDRIRIIKAVCILLDIQLTTHE